jgi:menaquinone-dependent protoporphyrinogen IX oxidase
VPAKYGAVVFGTDCGYSRERRALAAYIARHRDRLAAMPTALFVVSDASHPSSRQQAATFTRAMKWRPTFAAHVPRRDRVLRSAARRMLTSILATIAGSRDVSKGDELATLADAIAHELSTARLVT